MASSPSSPSLRQRLLSISTRKSNNTPQHTAHPQESTEATTSTATTLTTTNLNQLATATSPEDDDSNNCSREQGSLNDHSTLTNSQNKHSSNPFYRRRNKSSEQSLASESNSPPHKVSKSSPSSSPSRRRSKSKTYKHRPSLLTRVVYKVVPCVGSQPVTPTEPTSNADPPGQRTDSTTEVKQRAATTSGSLNTTSQSVDQNSAPVDAQMQEIAMVPLHSPSGPSSPTPIPPENPDAEVIIPPPPSAQLLPEDETDGVTSGAVQPPGSSAHHRSTPTNLTSSPLPSTGDLTVTRTTTRDTEESDDTHLTESVLEDEEEERLIRSGGVGIPLGPDGAPMPLLPPIAPEHVGRKCLVLDLDETLVHSSFKPIPNPDFIVPVEIEYHWHHFHVLKRPGVDLFLKEMGRIYEVVVFTASLSKYADPVLDQLDTSKVVAHRLFRESCYSHKGNYVKDLSQLGRPLSSTIILDNSPASYIFHQNNAVPVSSWFNDPHDAELPDLIPFLVDLAPEHVGDVRSILNLRRE